MQLRHKIVLGNALLALIIALFWGFGLAKGSSNMKDLFAALTFISMVAAPVDAVIGLLLLLFRRKEWARGMLMSALLFTIILILGYLAASAK
jgi:ABC-type spermidine/putrescine transport system permease subunit II